MARDKLTIELKEQDLRNDLDAVMKAMSAIRKENLRKEKITPETKDEYLHLTYRLASLIERLSDKAMLSNMKTVADHVNKNPALLSYDYSQEEFWQEVEPEFSTSLDSIAIALRGDSFSDIREKHHVLNAIKFLGSADGTPEEKFETYEKILPFMDNSAIKDKDKVLKKQLGSIKGITIKDDTITAKNTKNLEALLKQAGYMGFKGVRVPMKMDEYEKLGLTGRLIEKCAEPNKFNYQKLWRGVVKYTKPLSYAVIGSLPYKQRMRVADYLTEPKDIQEVTDLSTVRKGDRIKITRENNNHLYIENLPIGAEAEITSDLTHGIVAEIFWARFYKGRNDSRPHIYSSLDIEGAQIYRGHFNTRKPFYWSLPLTALTAAGCYYLSSVTGTPLSSVFAFAGTFQIMYDFAIRGLDIMHEQRGSIFGAILGYAASPFIKEKNPLDAKSDKYIVELNTFDNGEIPGLTEQLKEKKKHLQHPKLEELAKLDLGEKAEKNLEWSMKNHYTYAHYFTKKMLKSTEEFEKKESKIPMHNAYALYDSVKAGPYSKVSALICKTNERYAVTCISPDDRMTDINGLAKHLTKEGEFQAKIKDAFKETNAVYMHISRFEKGEKKDDITVTR